MCGGDKPKPQKQSFGEREQSAVMGEKWNYYVQKLAPYQDKFVKDVQMTDADYGKAERAAATDTEAAYAQAPQVVPGGQRGGNLGVQIGTRALAKGGTKAANLVRSGLQTDDRHAAGVEAIIAAGNGERADQQRTQAHYSNLNFQQAQQDAVQSSNDFYRKAQMKGDVLGAVGAAASMGMTPSMPGGNLEGTSGFIPALGSAKVPAMRPLV